MRLGRLVLAFPFLVALIAAIDVAAEALASTTEGRNLVGTVLTAGLILSYAWLAPFLLRCVAQKEAQREHDRRRITVMLKRLARAAKIPTPKVVLIGHESHSATGVGVPGFATVFVTTGLLDRLDDATLRGVLAHELGHIGQRHALFQAGVFAGLYAGKMLIGLPSMLAPLILLGYLAFLRQCEFAADRGAAKLIGWTGAQTMLKELARMAGEERKPSLLIDLLSTHPSFHRRLRSVCPHRATHA
jgi:Zn-dependent protease with chaperone function